MATVPTFPLRFDPFPNVALAQSLAEKRRVAASKTVQYKTNDVKHVWYINEPRVLNYPGRYGGEDVFPPQCDSQLCSA
ncbi:uncharacterized [Tachysurus ichikawai]